MRRDLGFLGFLRSQGQGFPKNSLTTSPAASPPDGLDPLAVLPAVRVPRWASLIRPFVFLAVAAALSTTLPAQELAPSAAPAVSTAPAVSAEPVLEVGPPLAAPSVIPGVPTGVSSTNFSFTAEGVPIKQALALFARANHLNIVPDLDVEGSVTVEFHDLPLDVAMHALLEANGFYFSQEGALIRVRNRETRLFQIDYIHMTRAGQGSSGVQISSGGSGGSGTQGSSMTMTNTSTLNFWGDLAEQLKGMVSSTGSYTINSLAGTVLVRDTHRNIESIAEFISIVSTNIVRQVDLDVEIYEVALNNSSQLGINWQYLSSSLNTGFNALPNTALNSGVAAANPLGGLLLNNPLLATAGIATGGLIIQNPVFGTPPGDPAIRITHQRGNLQAVLDALKQQGDLKVVSKPHLRTLNNQPAVVRVGQDIPVFTHTTTITPGTPPISNYTESIQTITVGTVLAITPQVSGDGLITLDITPAVSRLVRTETSATGQTNAPVIDIRQASSIIRVRDGATIVMGGLVQDSATSTHRKIPFLGDIPLLGKAFTSEYKNSDRTELVFFVTPRIIHDLTEEKAVKSVSK